MIFKHHYGQYTFFKRSFSEMSSTKKVIKESLNGDG
jgi:hypothetical protein